MSSYPDTIAAHKQAAREACPSLTEAQVEGVWAIWEHHSKKASREDHDFAVRRYLTIDCGCSLEDAKKVIGALHQYDLCLF